MPRKPLPDERALLLALFDETTQFLDVAMPMASIHEHLFEVHAKYKGNEQGILEESAYVEELIRLADVQSARAAVRRCVDHLGKYLSDDVLVTSRAAARKTLSKIHAREFLDRLGIPRDKIPSLDLSPIDPDLLRPMVIDVLRLRAEIWAKLESLAAATRMPGPARDPALEARNRFICEEVITKGRDRAKVLYDANSTPGWTKLRNRKGLYAVLKRDASRYGLTLPPARKGRPPKNVD